MAALARVERTDFLSPMCIGEVANVSAEITYTSKHSVEVQVNVMSENILTGKRLQAARCSAPFGARSPRAWAVSPTGARATPPAPLPWRPELSLYGVRGSGIRVCPVCGRAVGWGCPSPAELLPTQGSVSRAALRAVLAPGAELSAGLLLACLGARGCRTLTRAASHPCAAGTCGDRPRGRAGWCCSSPGLCCRGMRARSGPCPPGGRLLLQRAGSGGRDTRGLRSLRASLCAAALAGCFRRPSCWQKPWDRSLVPMPPAAALGAPWGPLAMRGGCWSACRIFCASSRIKRVCIETPHCGSVQPALF